METTNAVANPSPTTPATVRTSKRCASTIATGSKIMPPARELRLWMRRDLAEKGLPETALVMTVTGVRQGAPDKRGPWLVVTAVLPAEWYGEGRAAYTWTIKMRPDTLWPFVVEGGAL